MRTNQFNPVAPVNVYVALGSNLGNPSKQILQAIQEIKKLPESTLLACSKFYKSAPMETTDNTAQADYVNAVVLIETQLDAHILLHALQKIECDHGRVRGAQRWGPRTLDLDILLYGDQILNTDELTIPHIGISERDFVLIPLSDINSVLYIPEKGHLPDLLARCKSHQLEILEDGVPNV